MANLKEIRNRISSVSSTMQITSAMKMVSAAKLKRAQDAIVQIRPYAEKLQEILTNLSQSLDVSENIYGQEREEKNVLYIAVTSNRGLCGGFNNNVIKKTRIIAEQSKSEGKNAIILSVGKKANDSFKKSDFHPSKEMFDGDYNEIWTNLNFTESAELAENIMNKFKNGELDKVVLVYNVFKNAAVQNVAVEQMLPVLPLETEGESKAATDYIFEPNKEEIVSNLIPNSLKTQFYKALLDSHAGEHGARMTSMHKATDNASDMLSELKLSYNKARQAAITNEILEIVGGAEALNN